MTTDWLPLVMFPNETEMMENSIILHAKANYDNPIGSDGRAMTIAAFHVAQNSSSLSDAPMRRDVLTFLASPSAVNYWKNTKNWLEACGKHPNGKNLLRLTPDGINECRDSLRGRAATNTTQEQVNNWMQRMQRGDTVASNPKEFDLPP